jgi:hypothetical protein
VKQRLCFGSVLRLASAAEHRLLRVPRQRDFRIQKMAQTRWLLAADDRAAQKSKFESFADVATILSKASL